jgi:hypothetical protein
MVTRRKDDIRPNGESPPPLAKGGGGRPAHRKPSAKSLANLKNWKPGQSGNPKGRAKSVYAAVSMARDLCPAIIEELNRLVFDPKTANRDKISAATVILTRGLGSFCGDRLDEAGSGDSSYSGMSPLLIAAGRGPVDIYRAELLAELHRIDAQERLERRDRDDALERARRASERGEEISAVDRMILQIKADTE